MDGNFHKNIFSQSVRSMTQVEMAGAGGHEGRAEGGPKRGAKVPTVSRDTLRQDPRSSGGC